MGGDLFIIRGIPGARKTTLARGLNRLLLEHGKRTGPVLSEDDHWTDPVDGSYHFDPSTRQQAFAGMYADAADAIKRGQECIFLATAALSLDDAGMLGLIQTAKRAGYNVWPIVLQRDSTMPPSVHGVTKAEMARFLREMDVTLEVTL